MTLSAACLGKKLESNWCSTASTAGLRRQCNQVRASPVCDASHMPRSNPAPYVDAEMVDTQIERRENLLSRLSVARRLSGYEEYVQRCPRAGTLATSLEGPPRSVCRKQTILDLETLVISIARSFQLDVLFHDFNGLHKSHLVMQSLPASTGLSSSGSASASRAPRHLETFRQWCVCAMFSHGKEAG